MKLLFKLKCAAITQIAYKGSFIFFARCENCPHIHVITVTEWRDNTLQLEQLF